MQHKVVGLLLVLTLSSLAGCLGSEEVETTLPETVPVETQWIVDALGDPVDPTAFGGELPVFDLVSFTDRVSGEPTIGITPEGSIWYASIDFDYDVAGQTALPSTVYFRSQDGGETWTGFQPNMGGQDTQPTSFDPYVYVDPVTGRVYAMDMGPHVACNNVSWTDDDGETWVTRQGACIPGANDHPTIFAGPATPFTNTAVYPNHLYLCTNQITDTLCYHSPDGGLNWLVGEPTHVGYDVNRFETDNYALGGLCGGLSGHGHASFVTGTLYLGRSWCGDVTVSTSKDGGLTWNMKTIATQDPFRATRDHDVSIATDSVGNAYAFWIGNEGRAVYLAKSFDNGDTWTEPTNVTAPGVTAVKLPTMVAGDEGRISFLYIGSDNPHGHRIGAVVPEDELGENATKECWETNNGNMCYKYADELNATTWNAYNGISLNAHEDDTIYVHSMVNDPDMPLKRGTCSGRCPGNGVEGGFYDFIDIDIHPETGQIYMALVDVCTEECDGEGYGAFNSINRSWGTVGRQLGGSFLRDDVIGVIAEPVEGTA